MKGFWYWFGRFSMYYAILMMTKVSLFFESSNLRINLTESEVIDSIKRGILEKHWKESMKLTGDEK